MPRKPVIAVVGSGQEIEPAVSNARELGRLIAENGWVLITGGRNAGVMKAANEGASEIRGSLTIGILSDAGVEVSPAVNVAIVTDTGEARNNIIVLTANVVIACGVDDPGTASEVALALKAAKPVVLLGADKVSAEFYSRIGGELIQLAGSLEEVIARVKEIVEPS